MGDIAHAGDEGRGGEGVGVFAGVACEVCNMGLRVVGVWGTRSSHAALGAGERL